MDVCKYFRFRESCEDGITRDDVNRLMELSFVQLWSMATDMKIHINSYDVYQYFIDTSMKMDLLKLSYVLTYIDIRYAKEIVYKLDYESITTLMGYFQNELACATYPVKVWLYIDLISICLNRVLVFQKMGFEISKELLFDVSISANVKELNPWLYRNLNEVFNIDREILKRKLIDGKSI